MSSPGIPPGGLLNTGAFLSARAIADRKRSLPAQGGSQAIPTEINPFLGLVIANGAGAR